MTVMLFDGAMPTSPALLERVRRRVERSLRFFARRVGQVRVWLTDLNSRKGGVDKRCRIVACVSHAAPIVVESRDADCYRAVDAAAAKLERAARHRLGRR